MDRRLGQYNSTVSLMVGFILVMIALPILVKTTSGIGSATEAAQGEEKLETIVSSVESVCETRTRYSEFSITLENGNFKIEDSYTISLDTKQFSGSRELKECKKAGIELKKNTYRPQGLYQYEVEQNNNKVRIVG